MEEEEVPEEEAPPPPDICGRSWPMSGMDLMLPFAP